MLPELDFVFKSSNSQSPGSSSDQNSRGLNDRNRQFSSSSAAAQEEVDDHHDDEHFGDSGTSDDRNQKFDEAIAAIVDENGAIHLDSEDGPTLLRIIANTPLVQQQQVQQIKKKLSSIPPPFNGQNSLPGTAASNRNTASQQMVLSKTSSLGGGDDNKGTVHFGPTSQSSRGSKQSSAAEADNLDIKTLKTGAGTVLVFNRTQLITVTTDDSNPGSSKGGTGNSSSTFILIDHQQPTATIQDGRQSLLQAYEAADLAAKQQQQQQNHRTRQVSAFTKKLKRMRRWRTVVNQRPLQFVS